MILGTLEPPLLDQHPRLHLALVLILVRPGTGHTAEQGKLRVDADDEKRAVSQKFAVEERDAARELWVTVELFRLGLLAVWSTERKAWEAGEGIAVIHVRRGDGVAVE